MSALNTLHDLMVHQIKDLYSAERQLVQALPKMAKAAHAPAVREALRTHLDATKTHVTRLEQCLEMLEESTRGPKCKGMEGLLAEGTELLDAEVDPEVLDAGLLSAAQKVEHYEISGYRSIVECARVMGHKEVHALLTQTFEEEQQTDAQLTGLAIEGMTALAERDGQVDMGEGDDETVATSPSAPIAGAKSAPPASGGRRRAAVK